MSVIRDGWLKLHTPYRAQQGFWPSFHKHRHVQKEPERSLWDPCRSKNRKRSASHEGERDAKRGDVTEHSSKTGHHHRPEARDRHARTHHSANPHRHDAGRSGHHDSHRHHRATSGRIESGLALDRQHRESAGRDERHSSADWQLEASARHYEKTRPADRHYRPHDGRDVGHRSISRHRADKHHMHSFGRSLSRMEDRPQQVHVAEGHRHDISRSGQHQTHSFCRTSPPLRALQQRVASTAPCHRPE